MHVGHHPRSVACSTFPHLDVLRAQPTTGRNLPVPPQGPVVGWLLPLMHGCCRPFRYRARTAETVTMPTTKTLWDCAYYAAIGQIVCTPHRTAAPAPRSGFPHEGPPDSQRSLRQAASRAARGVRLRVHEFKLVHRWTLTYEGQAPELSHVYTDLTQFGRRLRRAGVRDRLAVPESGDGRWHVHVVFDSAVDGEAVQEAWGRGLVTADDTPNDSPERSISDYLTKEFWRPPSRRRYVASRGLVPTEPVRLAACDLGDALERGTVLTGSPLSNTVVTPYVTIFDFGSN